MAYLCNWDPNTSLCSTLAKPVQAKWFSRPQKCAATDPYADLCQASLPYTKTSLYERLLKGEEIFFSIGKIYNNDNELVQVPKLQYCQWDFYLTANR